MIETTKREIPRIVTYPFAPFLLTTLQTDGGRGCFVIDKWEEATIDITDDGQFTQTFKWTTHKASAEEIEQFVKDESE